MFAVFKIMRQLHEMLWYLAEAQERAFDPETGTAVQELRLAIRKVTEGPVPGLLALDVSRLEDADLSRALYLTQPQLNSARGSLGTRLPGGLDVPGHWHGDQHPGIQEL
jgi:hypothetical protein